MKFTAISYLKPMASVASRQCKDTERCESSSDTNVTKKHIKKVKERIILAANISYKMKDANNMFLKVRIICTL